MTIYKSQEQTLKMIGLYLPTQCFSHGQLYIALSRVSEEENVVICFDGDNIMANNIVYGPWNISMFSATNAPTTTNITNIVYNNTVVNEVGIGIRASSNAVDGTSSLYMKNNISSLILSFV